MLEDFLLHEVLEATFFGRNGIEGNRMHGAQYNAPIQAKDPCALARDLRQIAIFKVDDLSGVAEQRHHVRSQKSLAVTQADDQGRAAAGHQDSTGIIGMQAGQSVNSAHLFNRAAEGFDEFQAAIHQVRHHHRKTFRVGFGYEGIARGFQLRSQFQEIFKDAVVHRHDLAIVAAMRMGVFLGGSAVGGPPCVADTEGRRIIQINLGLKVDELAAGSCDVKGSITGHQRHARAVVAAVFKRAQPVYQYRCRALLTDVSHDAAHVASDDPILER